jgi:hypothetical protein
VVSELIFGFRGTPLLLRVWLGLDRSSLSWVCDKPGFSGRFCSGDSSVERGMASSSRIEIEKFNGKNFELWKLKMEDLLVDKEQWIVVDPGTQPTGTPSTSTQLLVHNLLVHKLLVHHLLVCRRKIGRSWTEEQGVLFDSAWKIRCC